MALSKDVMADVVAGMKEFGGVLRGSLQDAIKLENDLGGL